jgi:crossover junction endodeoxyribonuclease RuvC
VIERWQPDEAAVEEAFVAANKRVAIAMGQARGVALLAAAEAGMPVFEYSASEVKQAVSGYGRGSKEQVQEMLRLQLGLEAAPQPADAADALATALCHLARRRAEALIAGTGVSSGEKT